MKRMLALLLTLTLALGLLAGCGTTVVVAVPAPPPEVQSPPGAPPFPQKSLSPLIPNKSRPSPEKPGKFHMGRPRPLPFSTDCIPGMGKE